MNENYRQNINTGGRPCIVAIPDSILVPPSPSVSLEGQKTAERQNRIYSNHVSTHLHDHNHHPISFHSHASGYESKINEFDPHPHAQSDSKDIPCFPESKAAENTKELSDSYAIPTNKALTNSIIPIPLPGAVSEGTSTGAVGVGIIAATVVDEVASKPNSKADTIVESAGHVLTNEAAAGLSAGIVANGRALPDSQPSPITDESSTLHQSDTLSCSNSTGVGAIQSAEASCSNNFLDQVHLATIELSAADSSLSTSASPSPALCSCTQTASTSGRSQAEELGIVNDFSSLNRADLDEVIHHEHLLEYSHKKFLRMFQTKVDLHPQRYSHDDYLQIASFLTLSGWPSVDRMAYCGIPNRFNKTGQCRMHQFCPYCCWREREKAQKTYVPAFHNGTWHFLTGSFTGQFTFTGNNGYEWLEYWNAWRHAFEVILSEGLIAGVYWVEELAINSFLPATTTLPHVHALVDAPTLSEAILERLTGIVEDYLKEQLDTNILPPNLKVSPLHDQEDLFHHVGYMWKPMKLLKPYQQGWGQAVYHNRAWVWQLNSNLTDFVRGHSLITRRRPKVQYKGSLNPKARKIFIGIPKAERDKRDHVSLINDLKSKASLYIDFGNDEESVGDLV